MQISDGFVATNGRHAALIKIPKALRRASFQHPENIAGGVPALLHRYGRNARERFLILIGKIRKVANDLHFRMPRNREVIVDDDAADSINRSTERFAHERSIVSGRPDFDSGSNILVTHLQPLFGQVARADAGADLDAEISQLFHRAVL